MRLTNQLGKYFSVTQTHRLLQKKRKRLSANMAANHGKQVGNVNWFLLF